MIKRIWLSLFLLVMTVLPTLGVQASYQPRALSSSASAQTLLPDTPSSGPSVQPAAATTYGMTQTCHFGLAMLDPWTSFDLSTVGFGNYVDWGTQRKVNVPANIDYIRVLYVGDNNFLNDLASLPGMLAKNRGAVWIIGNEPDSQVIYQDHISAEVYGERFYDLATLIRQDDPTATIAFGPVIQPTAVRMYYLTKALARMAQLAGGVAQAHALFDVYTIHGFILNEASLYDANGKTVSWGAGLPVGYDPATWPAPDLIHPEWGETWKTYDINIFKQRLINFRQWMKDNGDQDKPLWITEFGVLFPPMGNPYLYVSDPDTANYMAQTFDLMLGYKDPALGFPVDNNRLVQKWTWFSLHHRRTVFGGTLYDPANTYSTVVGDRFAQYNPPLAAVPVTNPAVYVVLNGLTVIPISRSSIPGRMNYQVSLRISNHVSSDRSTGITTNLYEGSTLIGSVNAQIPRCSGTAVAEYLLKDMLPGQAHTFSASIALQPGNGTDSNSAANSQVSFAPITLPDATTFPGPNTFFPMIRR